MKILDTDICKGCVFGDGEDGSQCQIKNEQRDIDCPCVECLLKSICMETCPTYDKLLNEVNKQ